MATSVLKSALKQETARPAARRVLVLEAGRSERNYWRDLWSYRELFAALAWRDLAVRYKQTAIGVAWAVIRPVLTVTIFTILFSRVAKLPTEGRAPYPVMVFAGMLPWFLFSETAQRSATGFLEQANLITKTVFPAEVVPVWSPQALKVREA